MVIAERLLSFATSTLGPFGGQSGNAWDDGTHTAIRKIEIATGDYVDSLRIEYDNGGKAIRSEKRGGNGGKVASVTLNYPDEFIISISGYIDKRRRFLRSIAFQTNMRKLGPFGPEEGENFSTPKYEGRIVGFFGRGGNLIDAIGAYIVPTPSYILPPKVLCPFGDESGNEWDDGTYTAVRQIEIAVGDFVNSIRVQYEKGGRPVWSEKRGGDGGEKSLVTLNYPGEFIIKISGYLVKGSRYVQSLTFETNLRKLGPYGHEGGEFFSTLVKDFKIVGFYGRSGSCINSIGVHMVPIPMPSNLPFPPASLGPFGGQGGNPWKDEGYSAIRQFEIATGDYVDSIRLQYDKAGRAVWSEKHGGNGGQKTLVTLNYPGEFIISISGFVDKQKRCVRSLAFETNERKLGPFGSEVGESFASPNYEGKIVGFFGRSGTLLDSFGAFMEPIWE